MASTRSTAESERDFLNGGSGNDILRGDIGNDVLRGGDGNDTLDGGATPTSSPEELFGGAGNDILKGSNASMTGGAGDDRILFAAGYGHSDVEDFVTGGSEDKIDLTAFTNLHSLADVLALVTASSQSGATIQFNASDRLNLDYANGGSLTEADFIFVPLALDFTGTAANNTWSLTRTNLAALPDKRGDGGAGTDTLSINLIGFTGVLTSGIGTDTGGFGAGTAFYHLSNNVDVWHRNFEIFNIIGGSGNDNFGGGALNDTLNGGIGTDTMRGLAGNDTYVVDRTTDVVTEAIGAGTDLVQSAATYTLSVNVENLTFYRHRRDQRHRQHAQQHHHRQHQRQHPRWWPGTDTLIGGAGNDTYVLSNGADKVTDTAGTDTITSTITRSLATFATIEKLTLLGDGRDQRHRQWARQHASPATPARTSSTVGRHRHADRRRRQRHLRLSNGSRQGHRHRRHRHRHLDHHPLARDVHHDREADAARHRRHQRHRQCAGQHHHRQRRTTRCPA